MKLSEIKVITQAAANTGSLSAEIAELAIDSRKILDAATCLFIALKGTFRDGHQFITDAFEKGVRAFLVSEMPESLADFPGAAFLVVGDTLKAIQQIATAHREQFHLPVIGITGSNGKTSVKEWLFQLLADDYTIVRNPKSYNSQIGVPLSVWQISATDSLGIFEAGISQPGEMEKLEKIIRPTWGIFTNIGDAHSESFSSQAQKTREKLQLFKNAKRLFYCRDHAEIHEQVVSLKKERPGLRLYTWSRISEEADLYIYSVDKKPHKTTISGRFTARDKTITIPFDDEASVENAIHCWNVLLSLKITDKAIETRMAALHAVAMRLETISGVNQCILINDTYNSDLSSLRIALDTLANQKQTVRKTVILSDLISVGQPENVLYETIAGWLQQKNIQRLIGIGPAISRCQDAFGKYPDIQSRFFDTTDDFLEDFQQFTFSHEAILLKGARAFRFEKIAHLLEQKIHKTVLEINLSALLNNLTAYKRLLPQGVKLMAMVKAFSYGSGSHEIAQALETAGIDYLTVAYVDEGVMLRKAGIQTPIMVMSPEAGSYDHMIFWQLEPEIFSLESLHHFQKVAEALNRQHYPVHLKIDSGMHRLGFMDEDIPELKKRLANNAYLKVVSIFSHLAGSGEARFDDYTEQQVATFKHMAEAISKILPEKPLYHILNSTGITRHLRHHLDMVRLGLGLYGIDNSGIIARQLIPIGTLKTTIAQIHELPAGAYVGYDLREQVQRSSRIATVNIGYADGYFRDFGNRKGYMLVHGRPAPVVGSVCMDMCMLDVTDIPEAQAGDEAIVFGEVPHLNLLSEWAKTIPYEIMTAISQRVNRVYVEE